ncbi:DNA-binding response regulator [Enterococcus sp. JM4C]|uniref:response regulator transcription factor n=1 Tax=Candidatus Enterococcus huntleyi TaxID=1857217 RepID=UPI00137AFB8F|nr:response regulator transcription factor [Enterococcus sp. JM4C]KAF1296671.1 DNA-binding response regulator [Enterococcus sp. JM4C]
MYRVLLVDDEYMILMGLSKIIPWQNYGFEVVATAENAKDALSILEEKAIDLVITDVTMPEMSGLEFIEAAQNQRYEFEFMILSGYQEFEYLKSGLQLGAVNYLMKPVNKVELIESLEKVKERLEEREEQKNQQETYREFLLTQWVNEELDEREEEEIQTLMEQSVAPWRVISGQFPRVYRKQVSRWLETNRQEFYYFRNLGELVFFVLIYQGKENVDEFTHFAEELFEDSDWVMSLSQPVVETEDIPEMYRKVRQSYQLHQFYGVNTTHILVAQEEVNAESLIDLSEFNRLVTLNKPATLKEAVRKIFSDVLSLGISPEDVRHIAFLLFMDIYRQFGQLDDEDYLATIQKINQAITVNELEKLLVKVIDEQKEPKMYSSNVQNVLAIIEKDYQKELTLKRVSDELHLNVMYLGQLFKKETKRSFSQFLNQFRMEKAQNLLLHSEKNINEIADEIGYNNSTYFSKMFKKMYGVSPKEYRGISD